MYQILIKFAGAWAPWREYDNAEDMYKGYWFERARTNWPLKTHKPLEQ